MRRLVIDCQILQTPAYDRGMGKYTLSLIEAFISLEKKKRYDKIQLLFNSNLEKSASRINTIEKRLKGSESVFLDLPTDLTTGLKEKYVQAQTLLTGFIDEAKKTETDFLITAPFFISFVSAFPRGRATKKFAIVYDLIPHKIWRLQRIFPDNMYFSHYRLFLEADCLFTISNAVKNDLIEMVGLPAERIQSIDGGPFARSISKVRGREWKVPDKPYVLMPSAPIIHKNNERAAIGFERFNRKHGNRYLLYITSTFDESTQEKLRRISKNIIFTGNIPDNVLAEAYSGAAAVLFPSLAEGLGMPVLEAAQYKVPVACSEIPVLSEMSGKAFYFFNPTDPDSIAKNLEDAVTKENWEEHARAYEKLLKKYTWERSAEILLKGLQTTRLSQQPEKDLRLVTPMPSHDSPAGYLAEKTFAGISEKFRLKLSFSEALAVDSPSYISYLDEYDEKTKMSVIPSIEYVNKRGLALRKILKQRSVCIVCKREKGVIKLRFNAKKIIYDKALKITGWKYYDAKGKEVPVRDVVNLITQEV